MEAQCFGSARVNHIFHDVAARNFCFARTRTRTYKMSPMAIWHVRFTPKCGNSLLSRPFLGVPKPEIGFWVPHQNASIQVIWGMSVKITAEGTMSREQSLHTGAALMVL